MGITDEYFDGYYLEEMTESQVLFSCLGIQFSFSVCVFKIGFSLSLCGRPEYKYEVEEAD